MNDLVRQLPHLNALLNGLALVLLIAGTVAIQHGWEVGHRRCMTAAFAASILFLISYLVYHYHVPSRKFPADAPAAERYFYYGVLLSHVLLAALVPWLALGTIYLALRGHRRGHVRLARWTLPIWLYVSVTGVVVYWMLYHRWS